MAKVTLPEMSKAYELLFEIENLMKKHIDFTLTYEYGLNWQETLCIYRELDDSFFRELVTYYDNYPPLTATFLRSEIRKLRVLNSIRNKVAHMKMISNKEYKFLKDVHIVVKIRLETGLAAFQYKKV